MLDVVRHQDLELEAPLRKPRKSAFTDRYLNSLKPRSDRYAVLDPSRKGLLLRVSPSGAKTFNFRFKRNGVVRFLTIGTYPDTTLRIAYEAHADLIKQLNRGEEPSLKQHDSVPGQIAAQRDQGPTVGELAEEFLKRYVYRERKRPADAARTIEADILKHWRNRPARAITRRDGVLLLDRVVDRGAPVMANRVAALLVQMFSFGVDRGMLDATPFTGVPRPGGTEKSRRRKLSEAEVRQFWRRLTRSRLSFEVRTALKLILVTAQRPGEVALAAWSEFDFERRLWTIPPERSKNGERHEVPLNDLAMILLRRLIRRFGQGQYILPSRCWRAHGTVPLTVRALSQGLRDNAWLRMERFTPHDLRRTAASLMTSARIPRLHVEKVLNHTIDDVAEIYDRHDYTEEKRLALAGLDSVIVQAIAQSHRKTRAANVRSAAMAPRGDTGQKCSGLP